MNCIKTFLDFEYEKFNFQCIVFAKPKELNLLNQYNSSSANAKFPVSINIKVRRHVSYFH